MKECEGEVENEGEGSRVHCYSAVVECSGEVQQQNAVVECNGIEAIR